MTSPPTSGRPSPGHPAPSGPSPEALARATRAARRAARRLRTNGALETAVQWSPLPLLAAVGALAYVKLTAPSPAATAGLLSLIFIAAMVVAVLTWRTFRRTGRGEAGALALDRHHHLEDRLTAALGFSQRLEAPAGGAGAGLERSLMELAIADALGRIPRLDPAGAVPLRMPRGWEMPALLGLGLAVLGVLEVQRPTAVASEPPPLPDRVVLFDDDVALLKELGEELEQGSETPEALADIQKFNRLVEDLAAERLDRREAFARLDALEREIRGSARELDALEEGLTELAQELERAPLSQPAGEALADKRLADAEQALQKLAERLRQQEDPPTQAELEQLRQALQRASETSQSRRAQSEAEAQEQRALQAERKRLLQKKQAGTATQADLEQLARTERSLERLGRDKGQKKEGREGAAAEQLSELDRKLAEAARELAEAQGQGKSSDFIDQSAESVSRMKQKQLSQKEKEQLLERMREMRDMLRQQKGGEQQKDWAERMRRLQRKAQGAPEEGEGAEKPGSGKPGAGKPGGVTLGPDGKPIPMAGSAKRPGQGPGQSGEGKQSGEGEEPGGTGPQPGSGHDPSARGETPSSAEGKTQDVMAVAPDTGQGTASSEVIYSAAQRGFTSGEYSRIFADYKTVAEDVIEREGIPPGYRSHVRRYFQLIRPRE